MEHLIIDWVRESLNRGSLESGERLPSENSLSIRFGLPRATVRRALSQLEEMGLVISRQGIGWYITKPVNRIPLFLRGDESFSRKIREAGFELKNRVIESRWLDDKAPGKRTFILSRLRIVDGQHLAIHTSFLPEEIFPNIESDASNIDSIFDYFSRQGLKKLKSGTAHISVDLPDSTVQMNLGIPALVPVLTLSSETYRDEDSVLIQESRIVYRGDGFQYRIY